MELDEAKRAKVSAWLEEGLKLSDIQKKLATELDVHLTYMELRFLLDDLKLKPKEIEEPAPPQPAESEAELEPEDEFAPEPGAGGPGAKVTVSVDKLARPGALVSGSVTFSDGQSATWHLDQFGRLGLAPKQEGYKPAPGDVQAFQMELQRELQRAGF